MKIYDKIVSKKKVITVLCIVRVITRFTMVSFACTIKCYSSGRCIPARHLLYVLQLSLFIYLGCHFECELLFGESFPRRKCIVSKLNMNR